MVSRRPDGVETETFAESGIPDGQRRTWALHVVDSPDRDAVGRVLEVESEVSLGRAGGTASVTLDDPRLSRSHLLVQRRVPGDRFALGDLGSKNGTFVNGSRVQTCFLVRGDVVRFGSTVCVFDLRAGAGEQDPALRGSSHALQEMLEQADRVATAQAPVLLIGETGTGKELLARRIHARSGRDGALVPVNCSAVARDLAESQFFGHRRGAFTGATEAGRGWLREADGGTLFLDEVGDMPLPLQPKLLRALESGEFTPVGSTTPQNADVLVLAATNIDLQAKISAGTFRADLYARIAGHIVELPPLRDRRVDIVPLFREESTKAGLPAETSFGPLFVERLLLHPWPMNVRELIAVARRAALRPDALADALPPPPEPHTEDPSEPTGPNPPRGGPPADELRALLRQHGGSVARLAEHYGKERRQVYRWLARHDLDPDDYREGS